jgi:hypothetical protein
MSTLFHITKGEGRESREGRLLPVKTRLDQLKGNVVAQESRLEEGMKMLNESKKYDSPEPGSNERKLDTGSDWEALERVIGLMDDLLISYRSYTKEIEKKNKWLSSRTVSVKRSLT